jgi:putative two-component system response regulator
MARILVIDDEVVILNLIAEILADAGHEPISVESASEALDRLNDLGIEIVVSDIVMPGLTGLELLEKVRQLRPSLPVVLVTGAGTHAMLTGALARGADGLVTKPFAHAELVGAVATALERSRRSERELRERLLTPSLASALANAIEARDATMQGHCERMSQLAVRVALEAGLADDEIETVRLAAVLHDVGKIGIPDRVLQKHGELSAEERALVETHPLIGDRLLEPLDLLAAVRPVVRHHHERWDGTGYPDGLAGEAIPIEARIVALADAVEAMSGLRAYRRPFKTAEIVRELEEGRGTQWQPELAEIALRLIRDGDLTFGPDGLGLSAPGDAATEKEPVAVLLVEDDPEHVRLAREALEEALDRVAVTHASDAASALELCRGATWSLVLVDHELADGNGLELVESVHKLLPDAPLVMLAADGSETLAVEALRRGISDYVVKSNGFREELSGRVRTLVHA